MAYSEKLKRRKKAALINLNNGEEKLI